MNPFLKSPLLVPAGRASFLTYEPYYGLTEKPFSLSADPKFLYKSSSHAAAFDDLLLGIRRREGLIVLTGDIGTGKTTLCRAVLDQLDRKTFSTFVPDPFVSREDLLKMLLVDFGVIPVDDLKSGRLTGATRPDLSYPLYEFLRSLLPLQALAVLIIDEAQNLSLPLLEEIRILSDLEAPEKLLQVVLVGQLEFRSKLKAPEMRQFDQRVSARCALEPMTRDGVGGYIAHRLMVAGGASDRIRFEPDAIDAIHVASRGVPRLINLVCDRALYRGYLGRKASIGAETVSLAVGDLGVGALTPLNARAGSSDISGLDLNVLHEPRIAQQEPNLVASPSPEPEPPSSMDPEAEWQAQEPDESLSEFNESASPRPGPRRARRLAFLAMVILAALLAAFLTDTALSYIYPGPDEQSMRFPDPIADPPMAIPAAIPPAEQIVEPEPAAVTGASPSGIGLGSEATAALPYAIGVATFQSVQRATQLVEELKAEGYPAYHAAMDLGARGRVRFVMVGAYRAPPDAESDLAQIRQIPGYRDARIVVAPSKPLSR